MRSLTKASLIGVAATLLLLAGSFVADRFGYPDVARALFWQNELLQSSVPMHNIGTAARPVYEGTPLNFAAFLASIPLGFIIYGVAAHVVLRLQRPGT